MSTTQMADLLRRLAALVEDAGLRRSPHILDARHAPSTGLDRMFSLDLQTDNTRRYRDADESRLQHALTVRYVTQLSMANQWASQLASLEIEEAVATRLVKPGAIHEARITYLRSRRQLNGTRELLYVDLTFEVVADVVW